jgi:hypothetical protein
MRSELDSFFLLLFTSSNNVAMMRGCAYFRPVYLYGLVFTAFHVILLILSCSLMCFTQRDTLETMLIKTGTISQDAAVAARQRRVAAPTSSPADTADASPSNPPRASAASAQGSRRTTGK